MVSLALRPSCRTQEGNALLARVCALSPLESTVTQKSSASPLESYYFETQDLKSFRIILLEISPGEG